jgi:hypothetical protein
MVKQIVKDPLFLQQKSEPATEADHHCFGRAIQLYHDQSGDHEKNRSV